MKICSNCGSSYEDFVEICADCGTILKTEEEMQTIEEEKKEEAKKLIKNPVLVESAEDMLTAEIFSDMLKDAEIPFFCDEDNTVHAGFGGNFFAVHFYVDEENFAVASEIFKQLTESDLLSDDGFFDDSDDESDGTFPEDEG